jgi:hypothetical protein
MRRLEGVLEGGGEFSMFQTPESSFFCNRHRSYPLTYTMLAQGYGENN